MAVISDSDLDDLASLGAGLALKDDCDILQETPGSLDSSGGHPTTWPVRETVKCALLYDLSPRLEASAQQKASRIPNKILLPRGTNVKEEVNRLRVGGVTYVITGAPDSSYEIFKTVSVAKLPLQGSAP